MKCGGGVLPVQRVRSHRKEKLELQMSARSLL